MVWLRLPFISTCFAFALIGSFGLEIDGKRFYIVKFGGLLKELNVVERSYGL